MIKNCIISGNMAKGGTGGPGFVQGLDIFPGGDGGDCFGAGIYCESGSGATIEHCTISNNAAIGGTGGDCYDCSEYGADGTSYGAGFSGNTVISNCILWGNTAENSPQIYGSPTVSYSDVKGGYSGQGNIDADPCFVTGPEGECYLSQTSAGQAVDSPCIDAGSDTAANLEMDIFTTRTDHIGDAGTVDMGYHYPMLNPADIDRDGDIDFADFAILASQWLEAPGEPSADIVPIDGDDIVDLLDLGCLVDNWLAGL